MTWDGSPVIRFLSESLKRPLSIRIDTDNIARLSDVATDVAEPITSEIALWHQALGQREVVNVELRYRSTALPTYDITRLIRSIYSAFRLASCELRAVLEHEALDPSALALLKGLGFSHCQFEVGDTQSLNLPALTQAVSSARHFNFQRVGVQIVRSGKVEELTHIIREIKQSLSPDYIFIGTNTYKVPTIDSNSMFTLFEDDIDENNLDHLALGPSAKSDVQGRAFDTLSDAQRYLSALQKNQLPLIETSFPCSNSSC